jgi:hypothetical protein
MATPKSVLIDIDIRAEDIKAAQAAMANAQKAAALYTAEITRVKKEQAEANKALKEGTISVEDYAEGQTSLTTAQKVATKGLQEANKEYQLNKTVVDAAKGSNDQLRAQLSLMTKEYNGLSKEQRENSARGAELAGQIKNISDKLKANESAIGDNRRNVGNYEGALRSVIGTLGEAGGSVGKFGNGLLGVADGFKAAGGGVKGFGMALMSLGLPLIIAGISALVGVFKSFIPVADAVENAVTAVKAAFGALVSGGDIMEAVNQSRAMLEVTRELEDSQRAFAIQSEKYANSIAQLIVQSKDRTKTDEERLAIVAKANKLEQEYFNASVARIDKDVKAREAEFMRKNKITEAEMRILAEGTTAQALALRERLESGAQYSEDELAQLQDKLVERAKLEGESLVLQEKLANRTNQLQSEMEKERQAISDKESADRAKAQAEREKEAEKRAAIAAKELADAQAQAAKMREIAEAFTRERMSESDRMAFDIEERAEVLRNAGVAEVEINKWILEQIETAERESKEARLNEEIGLIQGREQLELSAAEVAIKNTEQLEVEKAKIQIKYAGQRIAALREAAMLDGILTEQELNNIQLLENAIKKLQGVVKDGEEGGEKPKTLGQMLGLSEDDIANIMAAIQVVQAATAAAQQVTSAIYEQRIDEIDRELSAQLTAIDRSSASEEEKQTRKTALEKQAARERYQIELEQFRIAKALNIVMIIANTASAIMAQMSNPVPWAGVALAAVAGVMGAVQLGVAAAQQPPPPPKLAQGGVLVGPSHSEGGIPVSVDGRGGYEAEGGEIVLTKGVYRDPHLRQIASDINVAGGGVPIVPKVGKFAMGGALGGSTTFAARSATAGNGITQQQMAQAMSDAMVNAPAPVVRVSDINRVSSDVRRVQVASELR